MTPGLPAGVRSGTKLWLPFRDYSDRLTSDESGNGYAVAKTGSPAWTPGPLGDALSFASGDRLTVSGFYTPTASGLTVEAWVKPGDSTLRSAVSWRATTGGENHVALLEVSTTSASGTFYNTASTAFSVTPEVGWPGVSRWTHFRAVCQPGVALSLFRDGELVGYTTSAPATIQNTGIPPVHVGGEASTVRTSHLIAPMADVMIRDEADTDPATCAPRYWEASATRRRLRSVDVDLSEQIKGYSWTAGGGGYFIALSSLSLGTFAVDWNDVIAVKKTSGSTTTTYTMVGNTTDLAANTAFLDLVNSRLYVKDDPTGLTKLRWTARMRLADHGLTRGNRYLLPAVVTADSPERRFAYWNEVMPTGVGASLSLAAQALPAAIAVEEASNVQWANAAYRERLTWDGGSWGDTLALGWGIVDRQPDDDRDTLTIQVLHETARLFRVPLSRTKADEATWPNIHPSADGYVWPFITGLRHRGVPAKCVDNVGRVVGATRLYKWKWADHPVGRVHGIGEAHSPGFDYTDWSLIYNLDLSVCEFEATTNEDSMPYGAFVMHTDGLGNPSTAATSPADTSQSGISSFGNTADTYSSTKDIMQQMLIRRAGYAAAVFGPTWAGTFGRALGQLRRVDQLDGSEGTVEYLRRYASESLTFPYFKPGTETCECEDVVKADAADHTLYDPDVLAERWTPNRDQISLRAHATALVYRVDGLTNAFDREAATSLALNSEATHEVREVWDVGLTGFPTKGSADTWLALARNLGLEAPIWFYTVTVSGRFGGVEQFDKVDVQTSRRPAGAGSSYRVLSVRPRGDGAVDLTLFPETPFPADASAANPTREALGPFNQLEIGLSTGIALATGGWTRVGNERRIFQGGVANLHAYLTQRFQAYGSRSGGAADSDLQLRIAEVTANGTLVNTLATIGGVPAAAGFCTAATSFANIPAADAMVEVQSNGTGGASGTLNSCGWGVEETSSVLYSTDPPAGVLWEAGYVSGAAGAAVGAACVAYTPTADNPTALVPGHRAGMANWRVQLPAGSQIRWVVYADGAGTTAFKLEIWTVHLFLSAFNVWFPQYGSKIVDFGTITTAGYYVQTTMPTALIAPFALRYTCTSGTGRVYAASAVLLQESAA